MPDVGRQEAVESLEVTGGPPHVGSMDPQAFPEKGQERGGLERNLAVHPLEGRAENLRGLSFWEPPGPKEPPRKVCPKTAGLGTIRLSCCHRGPRMNLHLSPAWSGGRGSRAGQAGLLQEAPPPKPCHPRGVALVPTGQDGVLVPSSQTGREAQRARILPAKRHGRSTNSFPSHPRGAGGWSHNHPCPRGCRELGSLGQLRAHFKVGCLLPRRSGLCHREPHGQVCHIPFKVLSRP